MLKKTFTIILTLALFVSCDFFYNTKDFEDNPLMPPSGVTASQHYPDRIEITWNKVLNANEYILYRGFNATGPFDDTRKIATLSGDKNSYTDSTGLTANTYYYYAIRSLGDKDSTSDLSVAAAGMQTSNFYTPTWLSASDTNPSEIYISWESIPGAHSYELEKSSTLSGPFTPIYSGSDTFFSDTSTASAIPYYYRVRAYRNLGADEWTGYSPTDEGKKT